MFPKEAKEFIDSVTIALEEAEKYQDELYNKTIKKISKMSKPELQNALINILDDAPEWLYDRFVNEYLD